MTNNTFSEIFQVFTLENIDDLRYCLSSTSLIDEARHSIEYLQEDEIHCATRQYQDDDETTNFSFHPKQQRGGVCKGGYTIWSDCDSLQDLEDRYLSIGSADDNWAE